MSKDIRGAIKKASILPKETVKIPGTDTEVEVRGMMLGERNRVGDVENKHGVERSIPLILALTVHDPATGNPVWNANSFEDIEEIKALGPEIGDLLQSVALRLSGFGKKAEAEAKNASRRAGTRSTGSAGKSAG